MGTPPMFDLLFRFQTALLGFALVLACTVLFVFGEAGKVAETGDAPLYNSLAANLIDHGTLSGSSAPPIEPSLYRLPGYPFFLAGNFLLFGRSHVPVKIVQFILFGLIAIFIYRILSFRMDKRTGMLAAALCSVHLPLIFFAPLIQTEILTTFLAVSAMALLMRWKVNGLSVMHCFVIGAILGTLSMVRPSFTLLIFPIALAIALENRFWTSSLNFKRAFGLCAPLAIAFSVFTVAWLYRNYTISDRVILSSAGAESFYWSIRQYKGTTNYNLWQQWEFQYFPSVERKQAAADEEVRRKLEDGTLDISPNVAKELSVDEQWRAEAREELLGLQISDVVRSVPGRLLTLWMPSYIHAPSWLYFRGIQRLPEVEVWAMLGAAFVGIWKRRDRLLAEWPLWIVPVYLSATHMVFHLETRYSIPGHPFVLIYAAVGYVWIYDLVKRSSSHWFRVSR